MLTIYKFYTRYTATLITPKITLFHQLSFQHWIKYSNQIDIKPPTTAVHIKYQRYMYDVRM